MGTPEFAVPSLRALAAAGHEIVGMYTQPDRPVGRGQQLSEPAVKRAARELGLADVVHQPLKLSEPGVFETLSALLPDVIAVVAYGQLLKQNVLDLPRLGCVNVHSSLLPRWRGAAPIQRAILAGDAETGVSTQRMVLALDAGDVLLQARTPISRHETAQTLHDRLSEMGAPLLVETLALLATGQAQPTPQDAAGVTIAAKLSKEMESLDPGRSALELDRQVRALQPWPGTSLRVAGQRLKIREAFAWPALDAPQAKLSDRNGMLVLGTAQGCLELKRVQWEGKAEIDAAAFLNGLKGRGQSLPLPVEVPASLG